MHVTRHTCVCRSGFLEYLARVNKGVLLRCCHWQQSLSPNKPRTHTHTHTVTFTSPVHLPAKVHRRRWCAPSSWSKRACRWQAAHWAAWIAGLTFGTCENCVLGSILCERYLLHTAHAHTHTQTSWAPHLLRAQFQDVSSTVSTRPVALYEWYSCAQLRLGLGVAFANDHQPPNLAALHGSISPSKTKIRYTGLTFLPSPPKPWRTYHLSRYANTYVQKNKMKR